MDQQDTTSAMRAHVRPSGMSYKFQRLRERLRQAIASGELAGKLPGERTLAKRFHVNAKTLSKALTDLAAEGLLDRSIGRGTYVKGSAPSDTAAGRWLVLCDADQTNRALVEALRAANPGMQISTNPNDLRPSFLNQFAAVIDIASATPEQFLRSLVVRGIPIVSVNQEPKTYSMHTVLLDMPLSVSRLARDLMLAGHTRFAAVEPRGSAALAQTIRQAAARYAPGAVVDSCNANEIGALVESGVTAVICDSARSAQQSRAILQQAGIDVPGRISVTAAGLLEDPAPCTGFFCETKQVVDAIVELLTGAPSGRPTALWLTGTYFDGGTIGQLPGAVHDGEVAHQRPIALMA